MVGKRIEGLDGVRAIALGLVLLAHAASTPHFPWPGCIAAFPHVGKYGVQLFFVLSGYLQTSLLLGDERKRGDISIWRFYDKRLLRIAPLFLLYLVFILFWSGISRYSLNALDIASVVLCFKHVVGGAPLLTHFWSLSIEILFYIYWPILLRGVPPASRRGTALTLAVLLPLTSPVINWIRPDTAAVFLSSYFRAEAIFLGCWLALCQRDGAPRPSLLGWIERHGNLACVGALVAGVAAEHAKAVWSGPGGTAALYEVQLATSGLVVYGAMYCPSGLVRSALNSGVARWLALISFGTYVWQQFFFFGKPYDWPYLWPPRELVDWSFWFPANVLLGLIAGALSHHLVERPVLAWRKRRRAAVQAVLIPVASSSSS